MPAGNEHHLQHRYRAAIVRNIYFNTDSEADNTFFDHIGIYPVNNLLLEMIKFSENRNGDIYPGTKAFDFLNTLKNILPVISKHPLPVVVPTTENQRLRPVLLYIHQHLGDNLTLESVGAANGFTEHTLSSIFLASLDVSFFQYLKLV